MTFVDFNLPESQEIDLNGLTVKVEYSVEYDEYAESPLSNDDHLGEFTQYPDEGHYYRNITTMGNDHIQSDYTGGVDYWQSKFSLSESMTHFSKQGMSKHNAYLEAVKIEQSALNRLIGWFNDRWYYVGLTCKILTESGYELSSDSLWSVESDCSQGCADEIFSDLLSQAMDSAKDEAERLQGVFSAYKTIVK